MGGRLKSTVDHEAQKGPDIFDDTLEEYRHECDGFRTLHSDLLVLAKNDDWTYSGWMIGVWRKGPNWTVNEARRAGWREEHPTGARYNALRAGANACEAHSEGRRDYHR